jgi:hypothetical protein
MKAVLKIVSEAAATWQNKLNTEAMGEMADCDGLKKLEDVRY